MTSKDSLTLRHNKYIVYTQIWAAFCLSIIASDVFNVFKIETNFFQIVIINNFVLAVILGILGLMFFRWKLKEIESKIEKCK